MKILKKIGITIAVLIAIPLVAALFINGEYLVVRETIINQPKDIVFEYVKYLKNQDNFSVWNQMDPNMKKGLEGTDGEVGAIASWDSEVEDVGKGEQEIMKITEGERIDFELRFLKPFESKGNAYFTTETIDDNQTKVQWGFDGKMPWPMNLMLLFVDFEKELGPALETGLTDLKKICEAISSVPEVEIVKMEVEQKAILFIKEFSVLSSGDTPSKIGAAYGEIGAFIGANELTVIGMPITLTNDFSMEEMTWDFDCAIVIDLGVTAETEMSNSLDALETTGRIETGLTYFGKVVRGTHIGTNEQSMATYAAMDKYLEDNELKKNGRSWEEYIDDPGVIPQEEARTFIYFPIK